MDIFGSKQPEKHHNSGLKDLFSTIAILAAALLIAILMFNFVFRSYQVDGPSMENTLQNNDKLIIWKLPRTWASITGHPYIPKRGEIIVFNETGLARFGQTNTKQLIKRVIGLPGDTVVVAGGHYTIYNKQNPKGFNPDLVLGYGKNFPPTTDNQTVKLGPDQLFVSGDNRPDSLDSRDFGPISASQIVGQLVFRVYPISKLGLY